MRRGYHRRVLSREHTEQTLAAVIAANPGELRVEVSHALLEDALALIRQLPAPPAANAATKETTDGR